MYYLGIDGGGSKTTFSLCDEVGRFKGKVELGPSNYFQIGIDGVTKLMIEGLNEIEEKLHVSRKEIKNVFLGTAAYGDVKSDEPLVIQAVKEGLGDIKFTVNNDSFNALAAGVGAGSGINMICGTGSAGRGYNAETNEYANSGGWLYTFGSDEASGYWMSNLLLNEFARQSDGRDEKTALYYTVKEYLQLEDDGDVIDIVATKWQNDRTKIASLSILIDKLARANDPYALEILDRAGKEISDVLNAIYKKLNFKEKVKVSYSGGVFKMKELILNPLRKYLDPNKMEVVAPLLSPAGGALLLALKNDGVTITDEIIVNLRCL